MSTPVNELTPGDIMEGVGTPNVDDLSDDGPLLMPRDSVESPFDEITILLSGSKYPTANLYFFNVWKIHKSILEEMAHHDSFMKDMVVEMKKKFDKYWNEYSLILAIALVFDPRYKLTFVEWAFQKIATLDPLARDMSFRVKSALVRLFNEYKSMDAADIETPTPSSNYVGPVELAEFSAFKSAMLFDSYGKSQLDLYLEEPQIPFSDNYREFDVLAYWRQNGSKYPDVARVAKDVLSIPVSTVASESAFSAGGRVIDKYPESVDDAVDIALALGNVLSINDTRSDVASTVASSSSDEVCGATFKVDAETNGWDLECC
ncbi:hypothetical protein NE237_010720 [Protea cynaroides]|uniref:Transposase n=1 Tax=Protea cynaroides TaxID=273540 RepID=A0A9Q0L0C1_9MAGN|nr:hypothetical protein NE237_010720 [Protea cynaroides]